MKKIILSMMMLLALGSSFSVLADKILIKGDPVVLEKRGDLYYAPDNYVSATDYYYVTADGANKVCYAEKVSGIDLDPFSLNVSIGGKSTVWNCYDYSNDYFTME